MPRPGRRDPRLPEFLPASRHEGVPLRRGQHRRLHLPLSRLELWHRRPAGRRAPISARPTTRSSTSRNGVSSRSRSCAITRARSGRPGTRHAPPFPEYLGDFTRYLDLQLDGWDGREGQAEVLGGVQKWLMPCNWKFPAENFSGDSYHNISHRSVDLAGIGPAAAGRRDMAELLLAAASCTSRSPTAATRRSSTCCPPDRPPPPAYQHAPIVSEYFRHCEEERRRQPRRRGAPGRRARRDLPQYRAIAAPAAHDRRVAPARPAPDRGVALVLRRPRRAAARSRISCATTTSAIPGRPG